MCVRLAPSSRFRLSGKERADWAARGDWEEAAAAEVAFVMSEFMDHPLARAALLLAAIFLTTAIGLAFVRRFRGRSEEDRPDSNELLTKFRDLHARGGLSDEEYRTIKTKLATELRIELSDNNNTG